MNHSTDLKASIAAMHQRNALLVSDSRRKPPIHASFSELSRALDPTIMQVASHLHNLGIVFRRVLSHPP
jgi:hypothetical protein